MIENTKKNKWLIATASLLLSATVLADIAGDLLSEFSQLEKNAMTSGQEWFDLAGRAREANELKIAGKAVDRAAAAGLSPIRIGIEKTRQQVAGGDKEAAVAELQNLVEQGFTSVNVFTNDAVINSMAGYAGYDALISDTTKLAYPCAHREGFNDFDFWIGEWDVHVANGAIAGTNSITRQERGCVLIERWENAGGGTGMSINYLDGISNEWVQVWNAEGGSQISVRGGLTEQGMAMEGTLHSVSSGATLPFRALWTPLPDGRVRQYFEQSNDDGATWVPWFEGFYTRKEK